MRQVKLNNDKFICLVYSVHICKYCKYVYHLTYENTLKIKTQMNTSDEDDDDDM